MDSLDSIEAFYPRRLLTLEVLRIKDENDEIFKEVISKLKSPLGLALILIDAIFTDNGEHLKDYSDTLDETKKVAFGLGSAERSFLGSSDKLAMYSFYQFAFQQFVQSSFRARQGKTLEEILKEILTIEEVRITPQIASSKQEKIEILKDVLNSGEKAKATLDKHDIDILAEVENKIIIFQMRSRDDTGGATAKPSLAELLKDLKNEDLSKEILYLIYTWVKPEDSVPPQKVTLINKLLSMIGLENETELKETLKQGKVAEIKKNLKVCIVYGAEELIQTLWNEFEIEIDDRYEKLMEKYKRYLELLSNWDELWLSYAIATLELENLIKHKRTNMNVLHDKLIEINLTELIKSKYCINNYEKCSVKISTRISPLIRGDKDLIPFDAVGDKMNYLRDLILLRIVYEHLEEIIKKIGIDYSTRRSIKKLQKGSEESDTEQMDIDQFFGEKGD